MFEDARLVKRPQKNFLWGYGTQTFDEQKHSQGEGSYFTKGQLPTINELINFLEIYKLEDIKVVDFDALDRKSDERYAIVCSGFSGRHCYSAAKILVRELKNLECP